MSARAQPERPARAGASVPRLVIAGTASGVGKTTVMVGLVRGLRARGLRVAVFKCGPDYLDPGYHARAAGAPCHNLDGWMMGKEAVLGTFERVAEQADIALIEGVMGLFDGVSPTTEAGSTAEIAKWLAAPVVLVVDASGMARSIAALVHGFADFDRELAFAGIVCNRVGSPGHLGLLREALGTPPILGGLPKDDTLAFAERHLGLRTADEHALPERVLAAWGERVAEWVDVEALVSAARSAPALERATQSTPAARSPRCRIGVAFDEAFHFYYEDNLRRLELLGAELVRFSPLADAALPDVGGLYLGGGYPELYAERLSGNRSLLAAIAAFADSGRPIYAECGGLMALCSAIRTRDGRSHLMAGVIPGEAVMHDRLRALGYVDVETQSSSLLGPAGVRFRGHEFRYSELVGVPDAFERAYAVRKRRGGDTRREGYLRGSVLASYVHAHWASSPSVAEAFVSACAEREGV